jgi:hypothetical protein
LSQKFTAVMLEESTSVYGVGYVKKPPLLRSEPMGRFLSSVA